MISKLRFFLSQIDNFNLDTMFKSYFDMIFIIFKGNKLNKISKWIFQVLIIIFSGLIFVINFLILIYIAHYFNISLWFMVPISFPLALLSQTLFYIFLIKIVYLFQLFFNFILYGLDKE